MFSNVNFNYDFCVVTLSKDVTLDADIKGDVELAKLPIKLPKLPVDCDKKSDCIMEATGFGYFHGCKFKNFLIF